MSNLAKRESLTVGSGKNAKDSKNGADQRRVRLQVRRRVVKRRPKQRAAAALDANEESVRPQMNVVSERAIPNLSDLDPTAVADYIEQFIAFVKEYTGWDINLNRETIELRLADIIAIVGPAVEFALRIKGREIPVKDLETFVLTMIRAIVLRVNFYAQTQFVMDDGIIECLAITFRNIYAALKKDWDNIDKNEQTSALLTLFTRCMPGCVAAWQKKQE